MNKHIIVISHRRSGTHLTIDSIRNNIGNYNKQPYINLDLLREINENPLTLETLKQRLSKGSCIIKTHLLPNLEYYFGEDEETLEFLDNLFSNAFKVYIKRDGRDVMVSLYYYMKNFDKKIQSLSFKEFLRTNNNFDPYPENINRTSFWKHHVDSWEEKFKNEMLSITYEEFIEDFETTIKKVSNYTGQPFSITKDVRMKEKGTFSKLKEKIKRKLKLNTTNTAVGFRKGMAGDYKNHFDSEDLDYFDIMVNEVK